MHPLRPSQPTERGFTLLELMIVVAILGVLAGGAFMIMGPVGDQTKNEASHLELNQLREAILRFQADLGSLPKQGVLALVSDGGQIPVPTQGATWFYHPANFGQLYENPFTGTGHALENWSPDTRRGWRGPYLSQHGEGYVDIGASLQPDGSGSPVLGIVLTSVVAVADPFVSKPIGAYLAWRFEPDSSPLNQWGRPYLLLDPDNPATARLVGFGANRVYEAGFGDDIVVSLRR